MKCPVCGAPFRYLGGLNSKDFGCSNIEHCSSQREASYHPYVSIVPGWHFIERYCLPFRSGEKWYCLVGPEYNFNLNKKEFGAKTLFQEITPLSNSALSFTFTAQPSEAKTLLTIPYMALPTNEDFFEQFTILVEKAMGRLAIK
jgi:hypothetical protein